MKFTSKISGTMVTEFNITPIFESQFVTLAECMDKITSQKAMDYVLDTFRFSKGSEKNWVAILDWDSIMKVSILNSYPEYESEMVSYFGNGWLKQYIRFNH